MDELNRNYAWPVTSVNREDYNAFHEWFEKYKTVLKKGTIYIWGSGIRGTEFSLFFKKLGYYNIVFIDSDERKWGGFIDEFPIISFGEMIIRYKNNYDVILISVENSLAVEIELQNKEFHENIDYFVIRTKLYEDYLREFLRPYKNNILVLGDCGFSNISINDKNRENLTEMMKKEYSEDSIKVLAMHGMGLRAYYNIFNSQISMNMKPKLLLLMINFDTLNGVQHLLPRSQHASLIQKIYDNIQDKNDEFNEYMTLVYERSKNLKPEFIVKRNANNQAKERNYILINYLYNLDIKVEGIIYLEKILMKAVESGINVISFIPPVNYMLGRELFGDDFDYKYNKNIEKILNIVHKYNFNLLNLSNLLEKSDFAEINTSDETANENGRRKICDAFIKKLREYEILE